MMIAVGAEENFMFCTGSVDLNWFNVVQCVSTELFPVLSVTMSKCVQEKFASDAQFKLNDFGRKTVEDFIERLKEKRTMNNTEITYLKKMFGRAAMRRLVKHNFC